CISMYIALFSFLVLSFVPVLFFFFFQAEDGIRDATVTGVQTCALPILLGQRGERHHGHAHGDGGLRVRLWRLEQRSLQRRWKLRSEERRVGKEWRTRWGGEQQTKKKREVAQTSETT